MTTADTPPAKRILLCANTFWYLRNFRRETILALVQGGFEVHCAAPAGISAPELEAMGAMVHPLPELPSRISPLADLACLSSLRSLVKRIEPSAVFSFTPKANLYCGLLSRGAEFDFVPNVSGLGRVFETPGPLSRLAERAYRFAFARAKRVVFQNPESMQHFEAAGVVKRERSVHLMGSGVNLDRFAFGPLPETGRLTFLFSGRLLPGKGIAEYLEACKALSASGIDARFLLLGFTDAALGATITRRDLEGVLADSPVEYLGSVDDVREVLASCHCFVLPSYYGEGVPRSAIEAAAMGRVIITTDHPGCHDTVIDGENGFLVPVRDAKALEDAMRTVAQLPATELRRMGERSRSLAQERFDINHNVRFYLGMANG